MERISESDVKIIERIYAQPGRVEVYKVQHFRTTKTLCMKKINVNNINEACQMQNEFIALAHLSNPGILSLISAGLSGQAKEITHIIIFTEYCEEGDLQRYLEKRIYAREPFTEAEMMAYLKQLVSVFKFMQEKDVSHRDIKPQNLFMFENGQKIKVGDLGSAISSQDYQKKSIAGTPLYLSPALRQNYANGGGMFGVDHNLFKSDVYSLGLTLLYMASLRDVADLTNLDRLEDKINSRINEITPRYPEFVKHLRNMLRVDETSRYDFKELDKELSEGKVTGVLTEHNISKLRNVFLHKIETKCSVCEKNRDENSLYLYNAGVICDVCFKEFNNISSTQPARLIHNGRNHKLKPDFSCDCKIYFCCICKNSHLTNIPCNKNVTNPPNYEFAVFYCPECPATEKAVVYLQEPTIFSHCKNDHYFCQVCMRSYNESNHIICRILLTGHPIIPNSS